MKFFSSSPRKLIHSTASVGIFEDRFLWFPAGTDETFSHSITRTAKSNLNQLKNIFYLLLTLTAIVILTWTNDVNFIARNKKKCCNES